MPFLPPKMSVQVYAVGIASVQAHISQYVCVCLPSGAQLDRWTFNSLQCTRYIFPSPVRLSPHRRTTTPTQNRPSSPTWPNGCEPAQSLRARQNHTHHFASGNARGVRGSRWECARANTFVCVCVWDHFSPRRASRKQLLPGEMNELQINKQWPCVRRKRANGEIAQHVWNIVFNYSFIFFQLPRCCAHHAQVMRSRNQLLGGCTQQFGRLSKTHTKRPWFVWIVERRFGNHIT